MKAHSQPVPWPQAARYCAVFGVCYAAMLALAAIGIPGGQLNMAVRGVPTLHQRGGVEGDCILSCPTSACVCGEGQQLSACGQQAVWGVVRGMP